MTLLFRGWSTLAGASMVLLIPLWLTRSEQGYYFTLLSLLALQIFFELGLNQIIVQLVSHEAAHLKRVDDGSFQGDRAGIARLIWLTRLIRRWYVVAAVLFASLAGGGGALFFVIHDRAAAGTIVPIWLLLVLLNSVTLYLSPSLAVLEGCGEVDRVARLRLYQSLVGYSCTWAAFAAGAGLWSVVAISSISVLVTGYYVLFGNQRLRWLRHHLAEGVSTIQWKRDILPLQWKIAVSWISGYFIMQTFVPMTFAHQGATAAGQLGLTLAAFGALQTLGMSWVIAKMPVLTALISRQQHLELRHLFLAIVGRSLAFITLGILAIVLGLELLAPAFRIRFAPQSVVMTLAAVTWINNLVFAAASFMRAHREEPMAVQSVVVALLMIPTVYFGSSASVELTMSIYLGLSFGISAPWTALLMRRYWRRHAA